MAKEYPDTDALFDPDKYDATVRRAGKFLDTVWGYEVIGEENAKKEGQLFMTYPIELFLILG